MGFNEKGKHPVRMFYNLGDKPDYLMELMEEVGFKNVQHWYMPLLVFRCDENNLPDLFLHLHEFTNGGHIPEDKI
jgi:hypothetical protein